ncbi:MAG: DUF4270 domain-containing protein [Bacteroidales bacterium]|nr:DUF4270 domain-containing protein [Bacteroidales bacterium]
MKTHHSTARTFLALMIGTLFLTFASCKKSPETIGNNLISGDNYIGVYHTDTVEIECHSYLDSVATGNATNALLGAMKDPVLGTSEAGFYTQFRPSVAGQSYGSNPVLDSIVLQLYISGYYGDTTALQTVHAYELTDTLSTETNYYNHSTVATSTADQANSYQFRPHPRTKTHIIGADTVPQPIIRIPLSQELGQYLMSLDTTAYSRPDLFKQYFKGLYLTCDPVATDGAITYINLTNNSYSLLQLYYHDAATPEKPMRYSFYVTSSDAYFNHIDHNYTQGSPAFVNQVLENQTSLGKEEVYLQAMGGVKVWIKFPHLNHWTDSLVDGHLVVNEAKLILPASTLTTDSIYRAPSAFSLVGFNADSTTYLLPDYYEGTNYFGGSYSSSNNSVTFRISEYLQSIIMEKKENMGISLGINGASYGAQRLVINGPNALVGEKMRLEVTYSIVNE